MLRSRSNTPRVASPLSLAAPEEHGFTLYYAWPSAAGTSRCYVHAVFVSWVAGSIWYLHVQIIGVDHVICGLYSPSRAIWCKLVSALYYVSHLNSPWTTSMLSRNVLNTFRTAASDWPSNDSCTVACMTSSIPTTPCIGVRNSCDKLRA